jgi:hypothetical protein
VSAKNLSRTTHQPADNFEFFDVDAAVLIFALLGGVLV